MEQAIEELRSQILDQLDISYEISDVLLQEKIQEQIRIYAEGHLLTLAKRELLQRQLFNSFRRLDVLQELLEQQGVTEIMVNGYRDIFYEKCGSLYRWEKTFASSEKLDIVIQQMAALGNKVINESNPIMDARLLDGSRVNVVVPPAVLDGPCITIRRFFRDYMSLDHLVEQKTLSEEMKVFLELLVEAGYNLFLSGGTGSGKTTLLNALSEAIPVGERVITIEDSAELQLQGVENLVRLEARSSNENGAQEISIRDLIRTALRMRPDRIIVGEVRGAEALELLQANNTGHRGSLSTGHGNSCEDMLGRLETMVLMAGMELPLSAVRGQIATGIDILVHLSRMRDKSRKVLQIWEVLGVKDGVIQMHPLYEFHEDIQNTAVVEGQWIRKESLVHTGRLQEQGKLERLEAIYR